MTAVSNVLPCKSLTHTFEVQVLLGQCKSGIIWMTPMHSVKPDRSVSENIKSHGTAISVSDPLLCCLWEISSLVFLVL